LYWLHTHACGALPSPVACPLSPSKFSDIFAPAVAFGNMHQSRFPGHVFSAPRILLLFWPRRKMRGLSAFPKITDLHVIVIAGARCATSSERLRRSNSMRKSRSAQTAAIAIPIRAR
jgi:hypothetical protein